MSDDTGQHDEPFPTTQASAAEPMPSAPEEWEQVRRSVAMLPPNAWAMRREQSLAALSSLIAALRS